MATVAERMLRIFRGYERCHYTADFTNATVDGGKLVPKYDAVAGPVTLLEIESHLAGRKAVLVVPVDENGLSHFAKIDVDIYNLDLLALKKKIARRGYPLIVERTKSGGAHLAFYPKHPWPASKIRDQLIEWAADLGFTNVEIFPKQDRLDPTKDTGSGINLPYFGGNTAKNYAIDNEGKPLTVEAWLDAIEAQDERLRPQAGQANVESAADFLAQFWTEGKRDNLNIAVVGTLLRAKIDEAAVEQLIELTRDIAGDNAEARRSVNSISEALVQDAKKIPGFTRLVDPQSGFMTREEALELLRLMGAKPPPDPITIQFVALPEDWLNVAPAPLQHTVRPLFPEKTVSLLVAEGGAGKTTFALRTALAVATGRALFGMEPRQGKVVYVALEDQAASLRRRIFWIVGRERERMMKEGASPEAIEAMERAVRENLIVAAGAGHQLYLVTMLGGVVLQSPQLPAFVDKLPEGLELVILDPMSRLNGAEENSNAVGTAMINAAEHIIFQKGCGVLIPHHTGKTSAKEGDVTQYSARGASSFVDAARSVVRLMAVRAEAATQWTNCPAELVAAGDLIEVHHAKCNEGRRAAPFYLRRQALDFELFVPQLVTPAERGTNALQALYDWWLEHNRAGFTCADLERADFRTAVFGSGFSRHDARELFRRACGVGQVISLGPPPAGGRPNFGFAPGFVPPEDEI